MKIKIVHLWILTTIGWWFLHWQTGMMLTIATMVILSQDKQIDNLKQRKE